MGVISIQTKLAITLTFFSHNHLIYVNMHIDGEYTIPTGPPRQKQGLAYPT